MLPKGMTEVITVPIPHPKIRQFLSSWEGTLGVLGQALPAAVEAAWLLVKNPGPWATCIITQEPQFL